MQIENLAAVAHAIAKSCGAKTVVDVGSGQVCHMHANSCTVVTRFLVDRIIFLILGHLASSIFLHCSQLGLCHLKYYLCVFIVNPEKECLSVSS